MSICNGKGQVSSQMAASETMGRADEAGDSEWITPETLEDLGRRSSRCCCSSTGLVTVDDDTKLPAELVTTDDDTKSPPHFDTLDDELFVEILQRIPAKDAIRCKSVSKRWFNSLSSPYFARCYDRLRSSCPPPFALFFYTNSWNLVVPIDPRGFRFVNDVENNPNSTPGFSLSFLPTTSPSPDSKSDRPVRFLASNNGLVLCCATRTFQKLYYVCNPVTMQWIALPPPPSCPKKLRVGFSFSVTRFRVVRIPEFESKARRCKTLKLEIFISETGHWTESVFTCDEPFHWGDSSAVVCNGVIHWRDLFSDFIFVFDPYEINQYRTIDLPPVYRHDGYPCALFGESQGCLRYALYHCYTCTFCIWEHKDYGSSREWCLMHHFHRTQIVLDDSRLTQNEMWSFHCVIILAFHPFDKDVMFLRLPVGIVKLDMRNKSLEMVCSVARLPLILHWSKVYPHVLPWWPPLVPRIEISEDCNI